MSETTTPNKSSELNPVLFDEVQLLLSEKRTALSTLRTGIAIFALPLSVLSILIATSRFYDVLNVLHLLLPLLLLSAALTVLGIYLIAHAIRRIHRCDRHIQELKRKHTTLAELID